MIRKQPPNSSGNEGDSDKLHYSEPEEEKKHVGAMHVTGGNSCVPTKQEKQRKLVVPPETSHILDGVMLKFMRFGGRPLF